MDKESYIKVLKENRKLKNDNEIEIFEDAIEKLLETNDVKCLYCGFDNDTEEEEVMFGLVHAVESYYSSMNKEEYFRIFIDESKKIYNEASEWVKLMNIRILNDLESLDIYIGVVKQCSSEVKSFLINIMNDVLNEDKELFQESVNKFIYGID